MTDSNRASDLAPWGTAMRPGRTARPSSWRQRWVALAVVLALVAGVTTWFVVQHDRHEGHAVVLVAPYDSRHAAAAHRTGAGCFSPPAPSAPGTGKLVYLDPGPTGATAVWQPGLNNKVCHALVTSVAPTQAAALARGIVGASPMGDGPSSCGSMDGSRVDLYFSYAGSSLRQFADVALTGCLEASAPGRDARLYADRSALVRVEPQAWARENSAP